MLWKNPVIMNAAKVTKVVAFCCHKGKESAYVCKVRQAPRGSEKAVAKREAADAKVKQLEAKLKEEENQQIVSDVASYNLSPEQLAQFLQLANSGRLQEMLSGQVPMPGAVNADTSGKNRMKTMRQIWIRKRRIFR